MKTTSTFLVVLAFSLFGNLASADLITWQTSVQMYPGSTSQSFVDNSTGAFVVGFNGTGEGSTPNTDPGVNGTTVTTVNSVDFQNVNGFNLLNGVVTDGTTTVTASNTSGGALRNDSNAYGDGTFSGDGQIFSLIGGAVFDTGSIDITGLTVGNQYMMQIFINDARSGRNSDWRVGFSDGMTDFATSFANGTFGQAKMNNSAAGEPSGDYVIGTFTSTTGGLNFEFNGTRDNFATFPASSQINGFQLRDLGPAIPEPNSMIILTLTSLVLLKRKRS